MKTITEIEELVLVTRQLYKDVKCSDYPITSHPAPKRPNKITDRLSSVGMWWTCWTIEISKM